MSSFVQVVISQISYEQMRPLMLLHGIKPKFSLGYAYNKPKLQAAKQSSTLSMAARQMSGQDQSEQQQQQPAYHSSNSAEKQRVGSSPSLTCDKQRLFTIDI